MEACDGTWLVFRGCWKIWTGESSKIGKWDNGLWKIGHTVALLGSNYR